MRVVTHTGADLSRLLTACTWSGSRLQVARELKFTFVQDDRDKLIPKIVLDCGYTVYGYDENNMGSPVFVGNIYSIEKDRSASSVSVMARDHLFVLTRSKTTKKFENMLPEDIAGQICAEFGVLSGNFAKTGVPVTFIAVDKTGYQIILMAYMEASKKNEVKYQAIMNGAKFDIIEKGALIDGFVADSTKNMTESRYRKSIEQLIDSVRIVDEHGNTVGNVQEAEHIQKYSLFQDIYKIDPNKDTQTEAKKLLKKPEESGNIVCLGDYRVKSSYSIIIKDSLFKGQFWIKSDTRTFTNGKHEMKLELEFENLMNK